MTVVAPLDLEAWAAMWNPVFSAGPKCLMLKALELGVAEEANFPELKEDGLEAPSIMYGCEVLFPLYGAAAFWRNELFFPDEMLKELPIAGPPIDMLI
jgi:hypothetical protein